MNDEYYLGQVFLAMDDALELGVFAGSVSLAIHVTESDDPENPNITFLTMAPGQYERASSFLSRERLYPAWLKAMDVQQSGEVSPDNSMILLTTGINSPHRAGPYNIFYVEEGADYPLRLGPDHPALLFMGQDQVPLSEVKKLVAQKQLVMIDVDPEWLLTTPSDDLYDEALEKVTHQILLEQLKNMPRPKR